MESKQSFSKRKTPEELLDEIAAMYRGKLKLYIAAAPGAGKTYKMLQDAHDLKKEGKDVVIGLIETHGRTETEAQLGDLEIIPLKKITYKNKSFAELDVEEILKRNPEIVLVDELAHTNIKGSRHVKRFMDVEDLLEAGIDVYSAVNIQHLESVHDIVQQITGIQVRERIPDTFIQKANEIQLIDVTPETLRKRLSDGKIYAPVKIEQSLTNFFTAAKLSALRELSLREVADDVDERMEQTSGDLYNQHIGIHEKILVCVHYRATAEKLIRRAWRMAYRLKAELFILNVMDDDKESVNAEKLEQWKLLSKQFNAVFIIEKKENRKPAEVIIAVAKTHHITQILLGQSARTRWEEIRKGSIVNAIMRETSNIDIHIVADNR